jgi:hypothetical protein
MTLELHPKDRRGATSRFRVVRVSSYTDDVPRVSIGIQNESMAAGFILDEEEMGRLIKGLHDAMEASKATTASRGSPEANQGG